MFLNCLKNIAPQFNLFEERRVWDTNTSETPSSETGEKFLRKTPLAPGGLDMPSARDTADEVFARAQQKLNVFLPLPRRAPEAPSPIDDINALTDFLGIAPLNQKELRNLPTLEGALEWLYKVNESGKKSPSPAPAITDRLMAYFKQMKLSAQQILSWITNAQTKLAQAFSREIESGKGLKRLRKKNVPKPTPIEFQPPQFEEGYEGAEGKKRAVAVAEKRKMEASRDADTAYELRINLMQEKIKGVAITRVTETDQGPTIDYEYRGYACHVGADTADDFTQIKNIIEKNNVAVDQADVTRQKLEIALNDYGYGALKTQELSIAVPGFRPVKLAFNADRSRLLVPKNILVGHPDATFKADGQAIAVRNLLKGDRATALAFLDKVSPEEEEAPTAVAKKRPEAPKSVSPALQARAQAALKYKDEVPPKGSSAARAYAEEMRQIGDGVRKDAGFARYIYGIYGSEKNWKKAYNDAFHNK